MADAVRAYDWSATLLGDIAGWSPELLAMANLVLASPLVRAIYWGPEQITLYNDGYRGIAGSRHPRALGKSYREIWPEAWTTVGPQFEAVYRDEQAIHWENFLIPIDVGGRMEDRYWSYSFTPVYEHGKVAGIFSTAYDTTESYLGARKLYESETRSQLVLQSIGEAVIVADAEKRVTLMNAVAERLTGSSGAEAQGRPLTEIFRTVPERARQVDEDPARTMRRLDAVARLPRHTLLVAKDGSEKHIDYSRAPIRSETGEREGTVLVFRDVSEKHRAEQERERLQLELSTKYFELEAVYETSSIALAMIDPVTFRFLRGNQKLADILHQSLDSLTGAGVFEIAPNVPGLREALELAAGGTPVTGKVIEGELANSPDVHRYWQVEYVPVFSNDGSVKVIAASSIEITAERQMQAALLQTEKLAAVGRLAASMAHEINNPLESVTNLLYLARSSEDMAEVQGYLSTAERELQRVSQITNQTLSFHRQSTRQTPALAHRLIEETLAVYYGRIVNSQVRVECRHRTRQPVNCFAGEIRQVLNNLVGNGIEAMYANGGRLLVRSREATNWRTNRKGLAFTVADTGAGMSPQVRKKIFNPFFSTKGVGGTGLGLWVSREIVERHQGSLRVRSSQMEGRSGTIFSFFLPFDPDTG
jgi:PAS domain S-box-containing protein